MAAVHARRAGNLSAYRDQQFQGSLQEQEVRLRASSTLYVGNLSFFTTEDQIYHLFSKSGDVKRVIMGLDRFNRTPCGFCFVEYYTRPDAEDAIRYVSGTRLDERIIRCDWDAGFVEGRQYGRGKSGGQVRDEFRDDYDAGRGGFGKLIQHRVDKFGPVGFDGQPNRRFERGKRKHPEDEGSNGGDGGAENVNPEEEEGGETTDRTTDLRLKLQKIREERTANGEANSENPAFGMQEDPQPTTVTEELSDNVAEYEPAQPEVPAEKANTDAEMDSLEPAAEKNGEADADIAAVSSANDSGEAPEEMEA